MNTLADLHYALAASRAADLRREACLARLARAARRGQGARSAEWVRTFAQVARQRRRRVIAASAPTAGSGVCCA